MGNEDHLGSQIDFVIITIREDENQAVLKRFPKEEIYSGKNRSYAISRVLLSDGSYYKIAIVRSIEQGEGHGQDVARDAIEDLDLQWILLVGIAGGVPAAEFTLGDVIAAMRLTDFSVHAALEGKAHQYAVGGGPMHKQIQDRLALLPAMANDFGDWNSGTSIGMAKPKVTLSARNFYGSDDWKAMVKASLKRHFRGAASSRQPLVTTGAIASSDTLVKDTQTIQQWRDATRQIIAVEMELGGVYIAARRQKREYPILALRGVSDIVGFKRHADWTEYACQSAAAFALAFIQSKPLIPWVNRNPLTVAAEVTSELLLDNCAKVLHRDLNLRNYNASYDVRIARSQETTGAWNDKTPIIVLAGESGQGKTWALYSISNALSGQGLVVLIDATGDADKDVEKAAHIFCEDIWKVANEVSLKHIGSVLADKRQPGSYWLTLCIDGVQNADESRNLARMDWETWGVRLLISGSDAIAYVFEDTTASRVKRVQVSDFTLKELHSYLGKTVGAGWPNIPPDVRDVLRRPLLARIYSLLASDTGWRPTNEYELYARFWQRITDQNAHAHPLDEVRLRSLARSILDGMSYPWPGELLRQAGLDDNAIRRLVRDGWFRIESNGHYEIVHSRLLNWAVAEGLVAAYCAQEIDTTEFCETVRKLAHSEALYSNQNLGYVLMDVFWLVTGIAPAPSELIDHLILTLESEDWHYTQRLYESLLPTLGKRIVPALVRRLESLPPDDAMLKYVLYKALAQLDRDTVSTEALRLLESPLPHVKRHGCCLLSKCPSAAALDRLWIVHCEIFRDPAHYATEIEKEPGRMVHRADRESLDALLACVVQQPDWLTAAVEVADPMTTPMHDFAHLTAALEGHPDIWNRCKSLLFTKVAPEYDYLLAWNVYLHRDAGELPWLQQRIRRANDRGAGLAFTGLTRISPDLAVQELSNASSFAVALNQPWCFSHLLLMRREATRLCILHQLQQDKDLWEVASAYDGSQDSMDVPTLELLLDALETVLDQIAEGKTQSNSSPHFHPLRLLCGVHRLELLQCVVRRRGSTLENKLADWLIDQASLPNFALQHDAADALTLLARMGNGGFTRVINHLIPSSHVYARYDALCMAHKRPDAETFRVLAQVSVQDGDDSRSIVERAKAVLALARCNQWAAFVRAVVRCGFMCLAEIGDASLVSLPVDDAAMAPAFESLASPSPAIGAILAIGLGQRMDKADVLCNLLERAPADSETAQACVQALGSLGNCGERSVRLLERQLNAAKHFRVAWIALLRNGSEIAIDALMRLLAQQYSHDVAINLLHQPRVASKVGALVREYLASKVSEDPFGQRNLQALLVHMDDKSLSSGVFQGDEVEERLRQFATTSEDVIWYAGAKAAAISALSVADRGEAYEVALSVLRNPSSHDRESYPYLLVQLNGERATVDLFEHLRAERQSSVRRAIGLALSSLSLESLVKDKLHDHDDRMRIAACHIAGWQGTAKDLDMQLENCLDDAYSGVIQAAQHSVRQRKNIRTVDALINAYHQESDSSAKWTSLDTILDIGDPGDSGQPTPEWVRRLCRNMPYMSWTYVRDALVEKQRQFTEKARSDDFFNRNN